jgi:hypothetical protein
VTYITDITLFSELLNVIVIPTIAFLAYKARQYKPQIQEAEDNAKEAIGIAENVYQKASSVLPLFENLQKLSYDYTNAAASGDISNEEAQTLLADIKMIAEDPAVTDLRTMLEGYTCSGQ